MGVPKCFPNLPGKPRKFRRTQPSNRLSFWPVPFITLYYATTTGDLEKACQTVHFSEQFREVDGKKEMTFDYRMKSGIAETTNALKLLEIVGLGEDDE